MRTITPLCALLLGLLTASPLQAREKKPAPPPALSAKQLKQIKAQLRALFKAGDESQRASLRKALRAHPPIRRSDAGRLARYCFRLAAVGFRIPRGASFKIKVGDQTGLVHVSGSGGRGKGLFIGLHGGGRGVGDGRNAQQKWQAAVGAGCVALFPTVLPNKTWSDPIASTYVNALIDAAKRTWGIDTNRVYLAGHSMGGFGTWMNGCHSADRFAAITPNAGGGYGKGVPWNLFNTPIYFYHSTDDARVPPASDQANARELAGLKKAHPKGYRHVYKEYTDIGHGLPKDGLMPIIKWVTAHRRDPLPKKVVWQARDDMNRQFYWLYSEKPESHGTIVARFVTRSRLEVKCSSADGLTVLLSPKLVDYNKPLVIRVNGVKKFEGYPGASVFATGVSVRRRNDARQLFIGHVTLSGGGDTSDSLAEEKIDD